MTERLNKPLRRDESALLVVDIQERLLPAIDGGADLLKFAERTLRAAQMLGVPVHVTEQYPRGLGPTVANIAIGVLGAAFDNIPLMFAVLTMNPDMSSGQWMLVTLSTGVGGSLAYLSP